MNQNTHLIKNRNGAIFTAVFASILVTGLNMMLLRDFPDFNSYFVAFVLSGLGGMLLSHYLISRLDFNRILLATLIVPILDILYAVFMVGIKENPSIYAVLFFAAGIASIRLKHPQLAYLLIPVFLIIVFFLASTAPQNMISSIVKY